MSVSTVTSPIASSSTLWATASKEWVIPAKPKPGRKPKKDSTSQPILPVKDETAVDAKGRRVQNRAAQRAFRERKQSQLAELQARVQSYEQGEIERNVALQNIAKRLKEENESLRKENSSLKDEVTRLKKELADAASKEPERDLESRKRWREDNLGLLLTSNSGITLEPVSRKRLRADTDSPLAPGTPIPIAQLTQTISYIPSPPSLASSPDTNGASGGFSPLPFVPGPNSVTAPAPTSMFAPNPIFAANVSKAFDTSSPPFDGFDCGLCNDNTPCVCRDLAMQQSVVAASASASVTNLQSMDTDYPIETAPAMKVETLEPSVISIPPAPEDVSVVDVRSRASRKSDNRPIQESTSILDNLPEYQPAVPLKRPQKTSRVNVTPIFQIRLPSPESDNSAVTQPRRSSRQNTTAAESSSSSFPVCSGDPSNCMACKDDDFGKAFCKALGDSVCTNSPCATCPGRDSGSCSGPCGDKAATESQKKTALDTSSLRMISLSPAPQTLVPPAVASPSANPTPNSAIQSANEDSSNSETIPANEAWKRLKSHPNIAFADLAMLADVVARRTKCSGPVTVIHPPPGAATPERPFLRDLASPEPLANLKSQESSSVLLTDPHAHYRAQEEQRALLGTSPSPLPSAVAASGSGPASRGLSLVPQEELRQCGRSRVREVDVAGVREALKILDAQFGRQ